MTWYLLFGFLDAYYFDRYAMKHDREFAEDPRVRVIMFIVNLVFWMPMIMYTISRRLIGREEDK